MAVELDGNVRMRGDTGPGLGVTVVADGGRLRLVSGNELVGDWMMSDIGIAALQEGFNIKAEGEEFVLRTADDAAFAEELGIVALSPRLARRLAARHNPEIEDIPEPPQIPSNLAAVGFAVAGALVVLGGTFLSISDRGAVAFRGGEEAGGGLTFWLSFVIGGILMIAVAYVMSIGARGARVVAAVALVAVIFVFGFAVAGSEPGVTEITAYGFISGGLVVGVAVLASGSLRQSD